MFFRSKPNRGSQGTKEFRNEGFRFIEELKNRPQWTHYLRAMESEFGPKVKEVRVGAVGQKMWVFAAKRESQAGPTRVSRREGLSRRAK